MAKNNQLIKKKNPSSLPDSEMVFSLASFHAPLSTFHSLHRSHVGLLKHAKFFLGSIHLQMLFTPPGMLFPSLLLSELKALHVMEHPRPFLTTLSKGSLKNTCPIAQLFSNPVFCFFFIELLGTGNNFFIFSLTFKSCSPNWNENCEQAGSR